jgi:hypothetical protein
MFYCTYPLADSSYQPVFEVVYSLLQRNANKLIYSATMKFDDIFKEIGEFGPYQRRIYVMLTIGYMFTQPGMLLSVFVLGSPDHRYDF